VAFIIVGNSTFCEEGLTEHFVDLMAQTFLKQHEREIGKEG
jgi:hypothetical protein